jgi:oligopeptide/dipeptide ABC transporter ATP-binding protein
MSTVSVDQRCIVRVRDLKTDFYTLEGVIRAVDGVSLDIRPGETLGLVGESGCGKSVTAFSILRLLPLKTSHIAGGQILYDRGDGAPPLDLVTVNPSGDLIRSIRGNEIAMIFQEPLTSLSPVHTIGSQIAEAVVLHQNVNKEEAQERAIEMLEQVGIAMPRQRFHEYPHQFSGGMRQRAMIAMALSCNPSLLIADEPTTALDVTIQAQILDLMESLQAKLGMAILFITHNLGVIAEMASRVDVMYMGRIVESSDVRSLFHRPLHPYTVGLLRSIPHLDRRLKQRLTPIPGSVPHPSSVPPGCAFLHRCPVPNKEACHQALQDPPLIEVEPGHFVRCRVYTQPAVWR